MNGNRRWFGAIGWCALGCAGTAPVQIPVESTSPVAPTVVTSSPASGLPPSGEVGHHPAARDDSVIRAVHDTVLMRQGSFQACFERGLERDPSLEGSVVSSVAVSPDGSVSRATAIYPQPEAAAAGGSAARVATTMPDAAVVECVLGVFRSLRFSASEQGATFSYPIVFQGPPVAHAATPGPRMDEKEAVRYKERLASWFNGHFRQPTNVPADVLEGLSVSATVNIGEGRRITRVEVNRWSGNDSFDAAARLAVSALIDQHLPGPPPGYPEVLGTSLAIRFAGRSSASPSH